MGLAELKLEYLDLARQQFQMSGLRPSSATIFNLGTYHEGQPIRLTYTAVELFGEEFIKKFDEANADFKSPLEGVNIDEPALDMKEVDKAVEAKLTSEDLF